MCDIPVFAVVGHPNKGKSSLVAILARDEFVPIGATPGTTSKATSYPLKVNGKILYELIDTPGFQQPRKVLEWLRSKDEGSATRPNVVRTFLEIEEHQQLYPEECALLQPIVDGAAIVYVVDGSVPFSPEYEIELEILRWCSGPRLGLVNPIASEAYVEEWKVALSQYCSVVRVFDPLKADFEKCLELLEVCAGLSEKWGDKLTLAIAALRQDRSIALERSVVAICDLIVSSLSLTIEEPLNESVSNEQQITLIKERFSQRLRDYERVERLEVENAYNYKKLARKEDPLAEFGELDLFSEASWKVFGLSRGAIAKLAGLAGIAAGGAIDATLGASTFFAGALAGGVLGAGSSFFLAERLVGVSIGFLKFGRRMGRVGPIVSRQLVFVLINRARLHFSLISRRSHADRSELSIETLMKDRLLPLDNSATRELSSLADSIRKQKFDEKKRQLLKELVVKILKSDI